MNFDTPIVRRKLSDEVFDRLTDLINRGDLRPGDALPSERELMARLGVGRPAIREAMQALSSAGLISIAQGERAKVMRLTAQSLIQQVETAAEVMLATSPDALTHLKEVRVFFERGMVRIAAERAGEADLADLRALLEQQLENRGDAVRFISADSRFHTRIAAISGNPLFTGFSKAMLDWLAHYRQEMMIWTGREGLTLDEHQHILDRIAAHDVEGAEQAMVSHLERVQSAIPVAK